MPLSTGVWTTINGNRWDYQELAKVLLVIYRRSLELAGARHDPRYLQDMLQRSDLVETFDDKTGTMLGPTNDMASYREVDFQVAGLRINFDPNPGYWGYADEEGRAMHFDSPDLNHGLPINVIDNRPQITVTPGSLENVSWLLLTLQSFGEIEWMRDRVTSLGYDSSEHQAILRPHPSLILSRGPIKVCLASQAMMAHWRMVLREHQTRDTS
jgi:hypothetical protein